MLGLGNPISALGFLLYLSLAGFILSNVSSPKIVATLFAKNEGELLQYWIRYYSRLFSPQQLVIFDNFSNDELTLSLLDEASLSGVKVFYDQGPYLQKGHLQLSTAQTYFPDADIFIPLDCDEFIVSVDSTGMPYFDLDHVLGHLSYFYFNRLKTNVSCWGIQQQFETLITSVKKPFWHKSRYYPVNVSFAMSKKLFHLQDVISVNLGHHHGDVRTGTHCESALGRLGIMHYHNRGPIETVTRALLDLQGFNYLLTNTTLQTLSTQREVILDIFKEMRPGRHKARELLAYLDNGAEGLLHTTKGKAASKKVKESFEFLSLHDFVSFNNSSN